VCDANCWCACDDASYVGQRPGDPDPAPYPGANRGARSSCRASIASLRRASAVRRYLNTHQGSSRDFERPPADGPLVELHGERLPVRKDLKFRGKAFG
jgi:hypothetical protein